MSRTITCTGKSFLNSKVGKYIRYEARTYYVAWSDAQFTVITRHTDFDFYENRILYKKPSSKSETYEELIIKGLNSAEEQFMLVRPDKFEEAWKSVENLPIEFLYKEDDYIPKIINNQVVLTDCPYTQSRILVDGEDAKWIQVGHVGHDALTRTKNNTKKVFGDVEVNRKWMPASVSNSQVKSYFFRLVCGKWVRELEKTIFAREVVESYHIMEKIAI